MGGLAKDLVIWNLFLDPIFLRTVFTTNFPHILQSLGISLAVSTYQAGFLIIVRADGDKLNTHFRKFDKPMGLAADGEKIALGSSYQILEFRNLPAVTAKLIPPYKHDACYLLRQSHITGDIDIHEMAYADDEIWFINTKLSCLCTIDRVHSFVPQWRPPFISGYDLTDRCHLNGLGVREGKPRYVTALGETDTPNGWRANRARGGILMDIATNEFICRGLSMPHSPRWYRDRLWVLESGKGSVATVDLRTGALTTVAELPVFTRGIDFWGNLAFIGLSQVRETAVFSGIPLTQRLTERICGIWIVNIVTGETLGFLRFIEGVQEIFAISVLPHRYPEVLETNDVHLTNSFFLPDEAVCQFVQTELSTPPERVIDSFSVIIPVYNTNRRGKGVLERTLKSIEASIDYYLAQEKPEHHCKYEVILVNDGSTDNTWEIVQQFVRGKSFYRLIEHDRKRGRPAARNTGARAATGKVLFFCNDDDLYYPQHIYSALLLCFAVNESSSEYKCQV
ncbi:MAG: TIGR03032 family protein [Pseudanabaenaceae cyanobacterium SKYGB_i_bin29]|nr:TIGR03032 family protein [Pseudanabaenaceae cyanobacterium SKYG29]MDW8420909.1 TIGR03032 family protein [Pseudanabaenaceae cyanobacterium SKYGB_i_bin29]